MTPERKERLEACTKEIAKILYRNAEAKDAEQLKTLEGIEIAVQEQMLENVSPKVGIFCRKKQWVKSRERKKLKKLHWRTQTEEQTSEEVASKSKSKIKPTTRKILPIGKSVVEKLSKMFEEKVNHADIEKSLRSFR